MLDEELRNQKMAHSSWSVIGRMPSMVGFELVSCSANRGCARDSLRWAHPKARGRKVCILGFNTKAVTYGFCLPSYVCLPICLFVLFAGAVDTTTQKFEPLIVVVGSFGFGVGWKVRDHPAAIVLDDGFVMGSCSSPGSAVHCCCVFDGKKKNNFFCHNGGDDRTESLADLCLEKAPPFHSWYFHSTSTRTYGFLMEKGLTYLVIANSGIGSRELLKFLKRVRDGYNKLSESERLQRLGAMTPVVRQLVATLEKAPRSDFFHQMASSGDGPSPCEEPGTPTLGGNMHDRKKDGAHIVAGPEPTSTIGLQKSPSANHAWSQHTARRLWLRQVKMVVLADVLLCFILLMVWLVICRGLECISGG